MIPVPEKLASVGQFCQPFRKPLFLHCLPCFRETLRAGDLLLVEPTPKFTTKSLFPGYVQHDTGVPRFLQITQHLRKYLIWSGRLGVRIINEWIDNCPLSQGCKRLLLVGRMGVGLGQTFDEPPVLFDIHSTGFAEEPPSIFADVVGRVAVLVAVLWGIQIPVLILKPGFSSEPTGRNKAALLWHQLLRVLCWSNNALSLVLRLMYVAATVGHIFGRVFSF